MNILLVEDDDLDAMMFERGLKKFGSAGSLVRAKDGIEALDILTQSATDTTALPHPFVVLLDINMPRMNGHELLKKLRTDDDLKQARVFMFTTSDNTSDVALAYKNNVSGYIVKPDSAARLNDVLGLLEKFWEVCEHPPADVKIVPVH